MNIQKFDGNNFTSWKFRIICILEGKDLDGFIKEDPPKDEKITVEWKRRDAQARGIITCAMDDTQLRKENNQGNPIQTIPKQTFSKNKQYPTRPSLTGENHNQETAMNLSSPEFNNKCKWILDSGATSHMSTDINGARIIDNNGSSIITAKREDNIYTIDACANIKIEENVFKTQENNWKIWHNSLAHINENYMNMMLKDSMINIFSFLPPKTPTHGWPERVPDHLRPYFQRKLELTVDGECLLWGMRVIIPSSLRPNLLSCLHETHSGMSKMKSVARSHFWWPNLDNEIEFLVNRCRNCQQVQDGPNRVKWQPWIWAVRPWQRIHIDYANKDNINLLIVVDSHSKWIEAFPMREITSAKTIEQLRRLFSSYGLPEEIVSDNGPQFTGSDMKTFLKNNGIKQTLVLVYHPQSNGLAERAVKMIKMALDKNKRKPRDTIQDTLSKILLAYRSTPHETTKKAPSELFIGRSLRTRLSIIHPNLESRVKEQQARQMKYDHGFQQDEFGIDDMVWCRNFRGGDRWIPGRIVGRKGSRVYTVLIHGQVKSYHRDQIRKRWENGGDEDRQYGRQREETDIIVPEADMPNRGRSESPPIETARQQRDSGLVDQNDGGISGESSRSPDPEASNEGPIPRRNPPRNRRPPSRYICM
ncbi:K02A2.6-like [Cordylochernes scorpioides]|uniref:RNA-directed DNA polymerase n=1 Tax=Cordylochernes scorpioides TaxID=51811 RepID=A0ABY6LX89_9ARAC|nr:K02A2.6-like [Cordylochernes scorpioides]